MIKIKLINHPEIEPLAAAVHAAKTCYQAEMPELKTFDDEESQGFVKSRLFQVSHHTTLQHQYFTFSIKDIAISDATFGLHLASPFYNSDQRSGRYCAKMFTDPDIDWIGKYIMFFWPKTRKKDLKAIVAYVKHGISIYKSGIEDVTMLALKHISLERPHLSQKHILQNAPKIAQEQLRVFIPTILPTALDYTINLSALVAFWYSA